MSAAAFRHQLRELGLNRVAVGVLAWEHDAMARLARGIRCKGPSRLPLWVATNGGEVELSGEEAQWFVGRPGGGRPPPDLNRDPGLRRDWPAGRLVQLSWGVLCVEKAAFERWLEHDRRRGEWPSQQGRIKRVPPRPVGRPRKLTPALLNRLRELTETEGFAKARSQARFLHESLKSLYRVSISEDTAQRMLRQLAAEDGDDLAFRRGWRSKRKP